MKKRGYSRWNDDEEKALRTGVAKYGEGKWKRILADPALTKYLDGRTNVDLKDKWRTMACAEAGRATRPNTNLARQRGAQTAAQALAMKRRAAQSMQQKMRGNQGRQGLLAEAVGLGGDAAGDEGAKDGGGEAGEEAKEAAAEAAPMGGSTTRPKKKELQAPPQSPAKRARPAAAPSQEGRDGKAGSSKDSKSLVVKAKAKAAAAQQALLAARQKAAVLQARLSTKTSASGAPAGAAGGGGGADRKSHKSRPKGLDVTQASPRSAPASPAMPLSQEEDALMSALVAAHRRSQQLEGSADHSAGDERRRRWAQAEPLLEVWKAIAQHRAAAPFRRGVPEGELAAYSMTIQRPTDLSSIRRRLEGKLGPICSEAEFHRDLLLIVHNAMVMSPEPGSPQNVAARELRLHIFRQMEILHVSRGGESIQFRTDNLVRGRVSPPELPPPLPEGLGKRMAAAIGGGVAAERGGAGAGPSGAGGAGGGAEAPGGERQAKPHAAGEHAGGAGTSKAGAGASRAGARDEHERPRPPKEKKPRPPKPAAPAAAPASSSLPLSPLSPGAEGRERAKRKAASLAEGALSERKVAEAMARRQQAEEREQEARADRERAKHRKEREAQRERERQRERLVAAASGALSIEAPPSTSSRPAPIAVDHAAGAAPFGAPSPSPVGSPPMGSPSKMRSSGMAMPAKKRWLQTSKSESTGGAGSPLPASPLDGTTPGTAGVPGVPGKGPPLHWGTSGTRQRTGCGRKRSGSAGGQAPDDPLAEDEETAAMQLMCMLSGGADTASDEETKPDEAGGSGGEGEGGAEGGAAAGAGAGKPAGVTVPPRKRTPVSSPVEPAPSVEAPTAHSLPKPSIHPSAVYKNGLKPHAAQAAPPPTSAPDAKEVKEEAAPGRAASEERGAGAGPAEGGAGAGPGEGGAWEVVAPETASPLREAVGGGLEPVAATASRGVEPVAATASGGVEPVAATASGGVEPVAVAAKAKAAPSPSPAPTPVVGGLSRLMGSPAAAATKAAASPPPPPASKAEEVPVAPPPPPPASKAEEVPVAPPPPPPASKAEEVPVAPPPPASKAEEVPVAPPPPASKAEEVPVAQAAVSSGDAGLGGRKGGVEGPSISAAAPTSNGGLYSGAGLRENGYGVGGGGGGGEAVAPPSFKSMLAGAMAGPQAGEPAAPEMPAPKADVPLRAQ